MHQPNQTREDTGAGSSRHRRSWYRTLRGRIIFASTTFATLLAILTACVSYRFFMKSLGETIRSSAKNSLQIVGSEINVSLERVMTFADWVQMDTSVSGYLSRMEHEAPGKLSKSGRILSLTVWQLLNDEYNSLAGAGYITRVIVMTTDGASFLQCLQSNDRSSVVDTQALLDASWFSALSGADGYLWELADPLPGERADSLFIPVVRPIERSTSADIVGYLFLEISPGF